MIVNYDKNNGWSSSIGNIFSYFTGGLSKNDALFVERINAFKNMPKELGSIKTQPIDKLVTAIGNVNQELINSAKAVQNGKKSWADFDKTVNTVSKSTSKLSRLTSGLKSFGSSVLSMGANMLAGFAIGSVISGVITLIDDYVHRNERLIEAGEEAKSSIESTFNEFSDGKSSIDSLGKSLSDNAENIKTTGDAIDSIAEKYMKLREGVSQFDNSNKSLSTDEYQSYIDISNQIADQFPTLIAGYDAQGNAILNLGSNADSAAASLTNLYNASMQSSNIEIGESLEDVYKGVTAQTDEYQKQIDGWKKNIEFANKMSNNIADAMSGNTLEIRMQEYTTKYQDALKEAERILGSDAGSKITGSEGGYNYEIGVSFDLSGVSKDKRDELNEVLSEMFTGDIAKYQQSISGNELLMEEQWDSLANSVGQYLQTSPAFTNLNGDLQNAMLQNITDLDLSKIESDYDGDVSQYIYRELLSPLQNMSPDVQSAVADLFNIDVNSLSFDEYQNVISDALAKAFPNDTETQNQMKELFGFDQVTEDAEKQLNRLRDQFGSAVDDFSLSELETGFDLVVNDGFSGTFDELKDKIEDAKALAATSVDLDVRTNMDAIEAALESENAGADYEKAIGYLEQAKELFDQGLVGTDDFKSIAAYLSPTGSDDPVNFAENYGKALRYLTDDGQGVQNFLEDLQSKGLATMETLSDGTQQWSYDIDDLQDAATDMGIGFEFMMDMFGRLEDYGFHNNFVGSVEDGAQKITDLSTQLAQEEAKLAQLQAEGANTTAIEQQQEKVNALKNDIQETRAAMEQLVQASADDYAEQVRNAKESISTLAEEREKILKENTYGSDTQQVADLMEQEIRNLAQQNGIELDANLNIIEPEELPTITINAKINKDQLDQQLETINEGQSLAFLGDVNGQEVLIEGKKTEYGTIIYTANIDGAERTLSLIENEDGTISFTAETSNVEEEVGLLKKDLDAQLSDLSVDQKIKLSAEVDGVDSEIEAVKNEYGTITYFAEVDGVKQEVGLIQNEDGTISFTSEFNTGDFESKLSNLTQGQTVVLTAEINGEEKIVEATKDKDGKIVYTADVDGVLTKVEPVANTDGTITFIPITDEVDEETSKTDGGERETEFTPNDKALNAVEKVTDGGSRFVDYIANTTNLPNHFSPVTRTVNYVANGVSAAINAVRSAAGFASGTMLTPAKASGTAYNVLNLKPAYVGGSVALSKDEKALVNEMGTESIIRSGQWSLLPGGMHIESLKKGDIVLNASQTKALLQYGKAPGHARAYASGSLLASYANGSGGGSFSVGGSGSSSGMSGRPSSSSSKGSSSKKSSSSSTSSAQEEAEQFEETIDWIEIAIDRLERAIDTLDLKASSTYRSWSSRNKNLTSEISKVTDEINLQQQGYNRYLKQANSVGLSSSWAKLVREGKVDISTIKDENLADKISEYQNWYTKALDCRDAIEQLKETESELYEQAFEHISTMFDGIVGQLEHFRNMMEGYVDQTETAGYIVSQQYYSALIDNEEETLTRLNQERSQLVASLNDAVNSGAIAKESESWYSMWDSINSVNEAIQESTTSIIEFKNEMRQIEWDIFDLFQDAVSGITTESDFLVDLMSNDKLFDDRGDITDQGKATMGLHTVNYNTYMSQADEYRKAIEDLNKEIAKDPYNQNLLERRKELLELQQESIIAAEDEREAIRDLVEDGINSELESLDELINKYLEARNEAKDLYDYEREIAEKQKEIADIEKQLAAYQGDDSEEGAANRQDLQNQLNEARQDMEETLFERSINEVDKILTDLQDQYSQVLNMRLDNLDLLLTDIIGNVNSESSAIRDTIISEAQDVGYKLTDSMNTIWGDGSKLMNVITTYGNNFTSAVTGVQTAINNLKDIIQQAIAASNKQASSNISSTKKNSSSSSSSTSSSNKKNTSNKTSSSGKGDGKARVGDRVTFTGKYYYDSYGKNPAGNRYSGVANGVVIDSYSATKYGGSGKNTGSYDVHIKGANGKYGDLGWVKLSQLKGYRTGIKAIPEDELVWTNEGGDPETIIRKDGSILTPVKRGDSVYSTEAHNNLWEMANDPGEFIKKNLDVSGSTLPKPDMAQSQINNTISINIPIDKVLDYNDFIRQMQSDPKAERLIQSIAFDQLTGRGKMGKYKVNFNK